MRSVVKHPRSEQARQAQLRRFEDEISTHRSRAIAMLADAVGKLEALCRLCDAAELLAIRDEYRQFLRALESLDPARVEDDVSDQLKDIERKLKHDVDILNKYRTDGNR